MAKLTANGAVPLTKVRARFEGNDQGAEATGGVSTFAFRSDGTILKKGPAERTYHIWRKVKPAYMPKHQADANAMLQRIVRTCGYVVVTA